MELEKIFTKKNIEILNLLEKESLHIRDIADRLKISPAKVHGTIQLFKHHNIVNETSDKNRKVIKLNKNSALLKNIESLMDTEKKEETEEIMPLFDNISPLDYRYYGRSEKIKDKLKPYLSEEASVKYLAKVEAALTKVLAKRKLCSKEIAIEVENASRQVTAQEVYMEEDRIKHNVRALANSIRKRVSKKAKPYVHFTTTSHDIICTADAARYKDFSSDVLVPALINLERTLIFLALREKNTLQIGRTHGQHAEPITFGFALAQYVSRLGHSILEVQKTGANLRGKI